MKREKVLLYSFWSCLILLALIIHFQSKTIFVLLGDYYYGKNNIAYAQFYYEKSFLKGNADCDIRKKYIYSIINSPLTIDSQRKLAKFVEDDSTQDEAYKKAKNFLNILKREIENKYPENYISQAPYNQKIMRWNHFPVTYSIKNEEVAPFSYGAEIRNAFSDWEAFGCLMFAETSENNSNIVVHFLSNNKNINFDENKKYIIAYTVPQISSNTLEKMDIYFYIRNPEGEHFTNNQIYNTALHEIFHALGFMGHSYNKKDIMYMSKSSNIENDARAQITRADISTLNLLYKIEPDITNENELQSEYIPYLILGNKEKILSKKLDEATNYINNAPTVPSGYIDLAENYVAQGKYDDAIKNLEKALFLANTDDMKYIIFYNLAVSNYYMKYYDVASGYIRKAMQIKNLDELHVLKAEILLNCNKEKAQKEYIYLIKRNPKNPDYIIRLVNLYIKDGKYLKARKFLKYFLKQNPKYEKDSRFKAYGILIW